MADKTGHCVCQLLKKAMFCGRQNRHTSLLDTCCGRGCPRCMPSSYSVLHT